MTTALPSWIHPGARFVSKVSHHRKGTVWPVVRVSAARSELVPGGVLVTGKALGRVSLIRIHPDLIEPADPPSLWAPRAAVYCRALLSVGGA